MNTIQATISLLRELCDSGILSPDYKDECEIKIRALQRLHFTLASQISTEAPQ